MSLSPFDQLILAYLSTHNFAVPPPNLPLTANHLTLANIPSCDVEDGSDLLYNSTLQMCSWNVNNSSTHQDGNGEGLRSLVLKFSETKGWADLGYFYLDEPYLSLNEVVRVYK